MFSIFKNPKKISIPKENAQTITELESYTVNWQYKTGWSDSVANQFKVLASKEDAEEFVKQLQEAAKLIGCYIKTSISQN